MTLLQPSYLWGLLALAVPIIIHLWSRKKVLTIKVGSTQFINETKSKKSNSIQLNEWWLLVLRCLILGLLVFILAQPRLANEAARQDVAYIFEPALLSTEEGKARFVQIPQEGRRLLIPRFPIWEEGDEINTAQSAPNYWQLAKEMESIAADSIVVFTNAFAKAVKGKRPTIKANINWVPVDIESNVAEPLVARLKKDSVEVLTVMSDANTLSFETKQISNANLKFNSSKDSVAIETERGIQNLPVQPQKPIYVTIVYDKTEDEQRFYIAAAFRAIEKYADREIQLTAIDNTEDITFQESDYLVVLDDSPVTDVKISTLKYSQDEFAQDLIEKGNTSNEYFLTKKLNPRNILEERFVEQLYQWMQLDKHIEEQLDTFDKRTIAINQLEIKTSTNTDTANKVVLADMSGPLWILLLVLLAGERILARIRKQ